MAQAINRRRVMNMTKKIEEVGKTSTTDKDPNTSDKFIFWLAPRVIVNPFDIKEGPRLWRSFSFI